jgi:hypothetical protein
VQAALTLNGAAVTANQSISLADITAGNGWSLYPGSQRQRQCLRQLHLPGADDGTTNGGVDSTRAPTRMTINVTAVNDAPHRCQPDHHDQRRHRLRSSLPADFGFSDANDSRQHLASGDRSPRCLPQEC